MESGEYKSRRLLNIFQHVEWQTSYPVQSTHSAKVEKSWNKSLCQRASLYVHRACEKLYLCLLSYFTYTHIHIKYSTRPQVLHRILPYNLIEHRVVTGELLEGLELAPVRIHGTVAAQGRSSSLSVPIYLSASPY